MAASSARDAEAVIEGYLAAIRYKSADALADLYAPDAVHVFPFIHGEGRVLRGREAVRARYGALWGNLPATVRRVDNLVTHASNDGQTIVAEFEVDLTLAQTGADVTLASVVVAKVQAGLIQSLRDYTDDLTVARTFGRRETPLPGGQRG
ncbi:MAG TPA: nuclear transport factor 2 family protein [Caulobacteraceae bacterium]|jgi:ketosteroid isomerase-like protein|nr:nuclear transport factor 2 family protein [Caulobacteraceae bacterium]